MLTYTLQRFILYVYKTCVPSEPEWHARDQTNSDVDAIPPQGQGPSLDVHYFFLVAGTSQSFLPLAYESGVLGVNISCRQPYTSAHEIPFACYRML